MIKVDVYYIEVEGVKLGQMVLALLKLNSFFAPVKYSPKSTRVCDWKLKVGQDPHIQGVSKFICSIYYLQPCGQGAGSRKHHLALKV